jgi:hypothetical protein
MGLHRLEPTHNEIEQTVANALVGIELVGAFGDCAIECLFGAIDRFPQSRAK